MFTRRSSFGTPSRFSGRRRAPAGRTGFPRRRPGVRRGPLPPAGRGGPGSDSAHHGPPHRPAKPVPTTPEPEPLDRNPESGLVPPPLGRTARELVPDSIRIGASGDMIPSWMDRIAERRPRFTIGRTFVGTKRGRRRLVREYPEPAGAVPRGPGRRRSLPVAPAGGPAPGDAADEAGRRPRHDAWPVGRSPACPLSRGMRFHPTRPPAEPECGWAVPRVGGECGAGGRPVAEPEPRSSIRRRKSAEEIDRRRPRTGSFRRGPLPGGACRP